MSIRTDATLTAMLWPIAIVQDRYQGTYTGGEWVAIAHADAHDFAGGVWSDDEQCASWYAREHSRGTARAGDTPQQALDSLLAAAAANPKLREKRLAEAIRQHRETVLADPSKTQEAEERLWATLDVPTRTERP